MATTLEPFSAAELGSLSEQATQPEFWRGDAPADIVSEEQWQVWSRHLRKRRSPKQVATLCKSGKSPLRWGLAASELKPQAVELLDLLDQVSAPKKDKSKFDAATAVQALSAWVESPRENSQSAAFGVKCLAVAHLLPNIAGEVTENLWWQILDELLQTVESAADWRVEAEMPADAALAQQLLAGELPLTLAYLFPEIRALHKLRESACEAISEGLLELTNGEGLVRGPCLAVFRALLASWTRSRAIGRAFKKDACSAEAVEQFEFAVTQALALSAPDGTALLGQAEGHRWEPEFLATAVRLGGGPLGASAAKRMFPKKLTRLVTGKVSSANPLTSDNCEWSGVGIMRAAWEPKAATVAIDYSSQQVRLEVLANSQRLLSGIWDWETTVDGKRLEAAGAWENTCWFTDKDADYLELSLDLTDGARLDRQLLLAREDEILLVVDNLHLSGTGNINHKLRLPLASEVTFKPEEETREGLLTAGKLSARVLPLALPEWRSDPRIGQLTSVDGWLQLQQERGGKNLSCPLLFDLKGARSTRSCTWRQLTVAEALEILPHDVAVGYRAQCGKQQWLFYRSMGPAGNRTIMGQNLSSEFFAARFLAPSGKIREFVEIEA